MGPARGMHRATYIDYYVGNDVENSNLSDLQWRLKPGHKSCLDEFVSLSTQKTTNEHTWMTFADRFRCKQKMAGCELRAHSVSVGRHSYI